MWTCPPSCSLVFSQLTGSLKVLVSHQTPVAKVLCCPSVPCGPPLPPFSPSCCPFSVSLLDPLFSQDKLCLPHHVLEEKGLVKVSITVQALVDETADNVSLLTWAQDGQDERTFANLGQNAAKDSQIFSIDNYNKPVSQRAHGDVFARFSARWSERFPSSWFRLKRYHLPLAFGSQSGVINSTYFLENKSTKILKVLNFFNHILYLNMKVFIIWREFKTSGWWIEPQNHKCAKNIFSNIFWI